MTPRCPVCSSSQGQAEGRMRTTALADGWRQPHLGVDVSGLLPSNGELTLWHCVSCDLRWYDPAPPGDPAFYEQLQRYDWYYQGDKPEYVEAARYVPAAASVLEVGCGRGAFASLLKRQQPTVRYRGLEFNQAAVQAARAAGHDVVCRSLSDEVTGEAADEADGRPAGHDLVCHFQVLEHVPDPLGFMRDSAAALRPGGTLLVAVPAEDSFVGQQRDAWLNMPPHHLTRWSDAALAHLCQAVGLQLQALQHEPVAKAQQTDYQATMQQVGLRSLWPSAAQSRLRADAAVAWCRRLRHLGPIGAAVSRRLQSRGEAVSGLAGRGHSVLVVARKRDG